LRDKALPKKGQKGDMPAFSASSRCDKEKKKDKMESLGRKPHQEETITITKGNTEVKEAGDHFLPEWGTDWPEPLFK